MEKEMATQSSILAWEIPWTEEPGGLLYSPWDHKELGTTWQLNNNKEAKIKYGKASDKNFQDWGFGFLCVLTLSPLCWLLMLSFTLNEYFLV